MGSGASRALRLAVALFAAAACDDGASTEARPATDVDAPVVVPRLWDAAALESWATPLAGLGRPPTLVSEEQYYAAPVDNLATYPVYHPSREPAGYREGLLARGPRPLIEPERLKSRADWIEAGRVVFESLDTPLSRTDDPEVIAHFTSAEAVDAARDESHDVVSADGILLDYRWVVDRQGQLKLSLSSCAGCHTRLMPDGSVLAGAPSNFDLADTPAATRMLARLDVLTEVPLGEKVYMQFGVPWREDDPHREWRKMPPEELLPLLHADSGEPPGTMFSRFNGSPLYKTRMADLRGIRDRRWLDATGTHRNRGPEDVARYGILVEYAPEMAFGEHAVLPDEALEYLVRPPDEAMYALGLYLYSLGPAPSPYPFDERARHGQELFEEEGCVKCHTPPLYTNNKLVPVPGFDPPLDDPRVLAGEVNERRVHTDPGLALETRKGTGYYKVPSLRGVWYRGLYGHSGFETSLEAWFDPARQRADHVPTGWRGPGVTTLAVTGHDFGLDLPPEDKQALIAFLRTL
ncbi:MAG TPA: hypothetical protein VFD43_13790 [Planctomycetota bacterium]|nr:hypothetical protein [Planctomycetota bacterium]